MKIDLTNAELNVLRLGLSAALADVVPAFTDDGVEPDTDEGVHALEHQIATAEQLLAKLNRAATGGHIGADVARFNVFSAGAGNAWTHAGTAWRNRDGTMTVYLDTLPTDGRLTLHEDRTPKPVKPKAPASKS